MPLAAAEFFKLVIRECLFNFLAAADAYWELCPVCKETAVVLDGLNIICVH